MSTPLVGLVMGSDSDWPVMEQAALALEEFGIAYEADVVSAHRMPAEMIDYGVRAAELTAMARTRPSWMSGRAVTTVSEVNCTLPAAVSVSAAAVPR